MATFKDVLSSLDEQGAPADVKIQAANAYYEKKILPSLRQQGAPDDVIKQARTAFDAKYKPDIQGALRQQALDDAGQSMLRQKQATSQAKTQAKLSQFDSSLAAKGKTAVIRTSTPEEQRNLSSANTQASAKQGLGNILKAGARGAANVPAATAQFVQDAPAETGKALVKEGQANIKAFKEGGPMGLLNALINPTTPGSSIQTMGLGAASSLRDLVQGAADLPKDIANTYAGKNEYVNPLGKLPEIKPSEDRPASFFVGQQAPYAVPLGRAIDAGTAASKLTQLVRPVVENAAIMAINDPKGGSRITNAGVGAALGVAGEGIGIAGRAAVDGLKKLKSLKPAEKPALGVKTEVAPDAPVVDNTGPAAVVPDIRGPIKQKPLSLKDKRAVAQDLLRSITEKGTEAGDYKAVDFLLESGLEVRKAAPLKDGTQMSYIDMGGGYGRVKFDSKLSIGGLLEKIKADNPGKKDPAYVLSGVLASNEKLNAMGQRINQAVTQADGQAGANEFAYLGEQGEAGFKQRLGQEDELLGQVETASKEYLSGLNRARTPAEADAVLARMYSDPLMEYAPESFFKQAGDIHRQRQGYPWTAAKDAPIYIDDALDHINRGAEVPTAEISRAFRELSKPELEKKLATLSQEALDRIGDVFGC